MPEPVLLRLSDTDLAILDTEEDVRGRRVVDQDGEEVGHVEDLLVDTEHNKVRFLQVTTGGFLGLGETTFLIPVEAVTEVKEDTVRINQSRAHVAKSPKYDPELSDPEYLTGVYGYYGFNPFWSPLGPWGRSSPQ